MGRGAASPPAGAQRWCGLGRAASVVGAQWMEWVLSESDAVRNNIDRRWDEGERCVRRILIVVFAGCLYLHRPFGGGTSAAWAPTWFWPAAAPPFGFWAQAPVLSDRCNHPYVAVRFAFVARGPVLEVVQPGRAKHTVPLPVGHPRLAPPSRQRADP